MCTFNNDSTLFTYTDAAQRSALTSDIFHNIDTGTTFHIFSLLSECIQRRNRMEWMVCDSNEWHSIHAWVLFLFIIGKTMKRFYASFFFLPHFASRSRFSLMAKRVPYYVWFTINNRLWLHVLCVCHHRCQCHWKDSFFFFCIFKTELMNNSIDCCYLAA